MSTPSRPRSTPLRFSHAVLGIAVIHQLIVSEWMAKPWKMTEATPLQATLFEMHEWAGLTATVLLTVLFVALCKRYGHGTLGRFLPWIQSAGRSALGGEIKVAAAALRQLRPPNTQQTEHLAAAVQGLGLLTLLFFAGTGTAMWLLEDNLDLMHRIGSIHELGAVPLKLYLLGHAGMAVIHEWRGDGLLRKMFLPNRSKP